MDIEIWVKKGGRCYYEDELAKLKNKDEHSARALIERIKSEQKYTREELYKTQKLKKLRGKNPNNIHELRYNLRKKIARIFIVFWEGKGWMIRLFIKKSEETPPSEISLAHQRARDFFNEKNL
ncbi:MAG: type II toxin-antitoxin system RelE/ParE family toxin [Patescibacteria group bacterium]